MNFLYDLDVFMLGIYAESIFNNEENIVQKTTSKNLINIAYELLYINPNYSIEAHEEMIKLWAMYYNCYNDKNEIIIDDNMINRATEYKKTITQNIKNEFVLAVKNYHKNKCLTRTKSN